MLNPFAHDFKPIPFPSPPEPTIVDKSKKKAAPKKTEQKKAELKKAEPKKAEAKKVELKKAEKTEAKKKKPFKKNTETGNGKKKDSQANSSKGGSGDAAILLESPFIAIEAAIDPIHRLDKSTKKIFEHGYERYIDWVNETIIIFCRTCH